MDLTITTSNEDVFAAMPQDLAWMQGVATTSTVNMASITEDCFYAGLRLVASKGKTLQDSRISAAHPSCCAVRLCMAQTLATSLLM